MSIDQFLLYLLLDLAIVSTLALMFGGYKIVLMFGVYKIVGWSFIELILQHDEGEKRISLTAGPSSGIPAGVCHRQIVKGPASYCLSRVSFPPLIHYRGR